MNKTIAYTQLRGAGARLGIEPEDTFRATNEQTLSTLPGFSLEHFTTYDEEGEVYWGYPEIVELDVVTWNGKTILSEIAFSISKSDVYTFERKVAFYERLRGIKADRKILITAMLDPRAWPVVDALGIRVYSSAYEFGEQP